MHEIFLSTFASFHGFNEGNLSHMKHLSFLCYVNTHSLNKVPNPINVTSFEAVARHNKTCESCGKPSESCGFLSFVLPLKTQPPSVLQSWRFFGDFTSSFGQNEGLGRDPLQTNVKSPGGDYCWEGATT